MIDFSKMKTAEMKAAEAAQAEIDRVNAEARKYLADTDWYVIRMQETGVPIPAEILAGREAARARVVS